MDPMLLETLRNLNAAVNTLNETVGILNARLTVIETEIADSREQHREKVSWSQMVVLSTATLLGGGMLALLAERALGASH